MSLRVETLRIREQVGGTETHEETVDQTVPELYYLGLLHLAIK